MWFSIKGEVGGQVEHAGPCDEFIEAAGDVAAQPATVHALIVEWSIVHGPLSMWQRMGDRFELIWESAAAVCLRQRDDRPVDFEGRATADDRVRASKRSGRSAAA